MISADFMIESLTVWGRESASSGLRWFGELDYACAVSFLQLMIGKEDHESFRKKKSFSIFAKRERTSHQLNIFFIIKDRGEKGHKQG